jgi:hypothetical protein
MTAVKKPGRPYGGLSVTDSPTVKKRTKKQKDSFYPHIDCSWMAEMAKDLRANGFTVNTTTFACLCAIYREYNMHQKENLFSVSHRAQKNLFFVSDRSFRKVLKELETVGCVIVQWRTGSSPKISLVTTKEIQ